VLLLDEATAAIDAESDASFRAALGRSAWARECAILTVAHRISTAREADHVIVMEAGRVAEQGTPAELLGAGGRFAALAALDDAGWEWSGAPASGPGGGSRAPLFGTRWREPVPSNQYNSTFRQLVPVRGPNFRNFLWSVCDRKRPLGISCHPMRQFLCGWSPDSTGERECHYHPSSLGGFVVMLPNITFRERGAKVGEDAGIAPW
jgi:hypothetical protein